MRFLSVDDTVYIHDQIIETIGGSLGVREHGLLKSISEKPKASFGGNDLYPSVFDKAAVLFEGLCNYHVFIDGNKRIAGMAMYRFLSINGFNIDTSNKELEDFTLFVATTNPDLAEVAVWIKKHSKKT